MCVLPRRGYAWARYCTWSNGMCYLAAATRGRGTVLGRMECVYVCYLAALTRGRGTVLGRMECVYVLPRRGYAWARYCTWSNGMRVTSPRLRVGEVLYLVEWNVLPRRANAWARYCTWSNGMRVCV